MAMSSKAENRVRRWREQRWLLDTVVSQVGVEFDQARVAYTAGPAGPEALAEFRLTAARIKKINDIDREFASAAARREAKAAAFEKEGRGVAARESYLTAALLWSIARWPIFELNDQLEHLEAKMNECYAKYIQYAPHPIERIEVPFGGQSLPAYLHLPRKPASGEKFPCVLAIGGMDGTKENSVAMYGDKLLERGIAVFAVNGPGQGECFARRINVTHTSHMEAAEANYKFLAAHKAIDKDRIVLRGTSMGTFFATQAAATLGTRVKALSESGVCHEPGHNTIFNLAAPSFKMRFMYMAGFEDEQRVRQVGREARPAPLGKGHPSADAGHCRPGRPAFAARIYARATLAGQDAQAVRRLRGSLAWRLWFAFLDDRREPADASGGLDSRSPSRQADDEIRGDIHL